MRYGDQELLAATLQARRLMHDAPLNPYRKDADGHRWVQQDTQAWTVTSRQWMELATEVDRRGLKQPTPDWDGDSRR